MGDERNWKRPKLKGAHSSDGIVWGIILMALGASIILLPVIAYFLGMYLPVYALVPPFGVGLFAIGFSLWAVSMIVREIRWMAYEAARRAGELEEEAAAR